MHDDRGAPERNEADFKSVPVGKHVDLSPKVPPRKHRLAPRFCYCELPGPERRIKASEVLNLHTSLECKISHVSVGVRKRTVHSAHRRMTIPYSGMVQATVTKHHLPIY